MVDNNVMLFEFVRLSRYRVYAGLLDVFCQITGGKFRLAGVNVVDSFLLFNERLDNYVCFATLTPSTTCPTE